MKKVVISILILLPFVLIVVISIAGRIFGDYDYIEVVGVSFLDESGDVVENDYCLNVNLGEPVVLKYQVYPSNASNQRVTFAVTDTSICSVSVNGVLTGSSVGRTRVRVTTYNAHSSEIEVNVVDKNVSGVAIVPESITGYVGGNAQLNAIVEPSTAENKAVVWDVRDSQICVVDENGVVTFLRAGSTIITVTTVDGGFSDECEVTVLGGGAVFNTTRVTTDTPTVDLSEYIEGDMTNAHLTIMSGDCSLSGTVLTFNNTGVAQVKLYIGDDSTANYTTLMIIYSV